MTLTELFTDIADAIRGKEQSTDVIPAMDFADRIENLPTGGGSELPEEYQQVEYVQSTGTQRIETDIVMDTGKNIRYVCKINFADVGTRQSIGTQGKHYLGVYNNYFQVAQDDTKKTTISAKANTWYRLDFRDYSGNDAYAFFFNDDTGKVYDNYSTNNNYQKWGFNPNYRICLFSLNDQILPASCKISNFDLYVNDVLVHSFIPCYRKSDTEIGMYDTVSQRFFTNAGTGTFLKGADV